MAVRGFLTYASYRFLGALTGPLPPRIGYGLARGSGRLLYALSPKFRRTVAHNIRHVLGPEADEEQVQALTLRACVNVAKGHYDLFRLSRLTGDEIKEMTRLEGREHIDRALDRGKGVIVISAHLGNVDIMGQLPVIYGVQFSAPIEHIQPERLFRYALKLRQSHGLRLIPADEPLIGLIRVLKRGGIVALPCDRDIADNTTTVSFFGSAARLPHGPVRLARRTGAALIPAFALRLPDDTFLVQIEPPLDLRRTGDEKADVAAGMEMVVAAMERHIARNPDQWLVAKPIWPVD